MRLSGIFRLRMSNVVSSLASSMRKPLCTSSSRRAIPKRIHLVRPRITARGCDLRRSGRGFPLPKGEGANFRHLALQIEHRGCDANSGAFPCFFEAVSEKSVPRHRNGARCETLEGRVGFGCPGAEVGEEDAQIHKPAVCSRTHFVAGSGAALNSASTSDHMRDVVANMTRQNLGAPLNVGMPLLNESPKMCKGDELD